MTQGLECDRVLELPPLSSSPHLDTALFMMETSGGSTITPRQACGVESAARKVAVILITIYCSTPIPRKRAKGKDLMQQLSHHFLALFTRGNKM